MKVFAVYSIKGGVGKTSAAVNLAYLSAKEGARTLIWDLDPQGAATFYLRVRPKVKGGVKGLVSGKRSMDDALKGSDYWNLHLLPADFSYRNFDRHVDAAKKPEALLSKLLQELEESYDHVFLDCAPSISRLSDAIFVAADALLVPTIPTPLSLRTLEQLVKHLDKRKVKRLQVHPFFSMVDRRKKLHRRIAEDPETASIPFLETSIPYSSLVEQMGLRRQPLSAYAPGSEAGKAFAALWEEVQGKVG